MKGGWTVLLLLLLLGLLLAACQAEEPPEPEGPTIGDIPIVEGAEPLNPETLPMSLTAITQVHRETVNNPVQGHFRVEKDFIDTIEYYDDEMTRLGWQLIDTLPFGDGGNVRRYYQGQKRAILAFEQDGPYTEFLLLQGTIQ